jgi:hypothetical protein
MIKKIYKRLSIISVMVTILLLFNWISPIFASVSIQLASSREGECAAVNTFNSDITPDMTLGTDGLSPEITAAAITVVIVLFVIWLAQATTPPPPPPSYTEYTVVTVPPGATVEIDGKVVGESPCKFSLQDPVWAKIVVKKEGYTGIQTTLTPSSPTTLNIVLKQNPPDSFVQIVEPGWESVEIAEGVEYDKAWASVVDLLVKKFDIEVLSKENGYVRTAWLYTWTGEMRKDYRVRATIKFSQDRSKIEVKSEANYYTGKDWMIGSDTSLLETLKADIMGTIGQATK